jgi:aminopeptidase N
LNSWILIRIDHNIENIFKIDNLEGHKIDVNSVQRNTDKSLVRIYIGERLESTFYLLNVEFHTRICTPDSAGVHCFYAHEEGREVLAGFSTKFEPCFARQFVPGWDEPRVKSTFNVSIRHFTDVAVLTNTAPLRRASGIQADIAGRGITVEKGQRGITNMRYEQSLPMPLYLLAFATGISSF